jgi:hypothetical protein
VACEHIDGIHPPDLMVDEIDVARIALDKAPLVSQRAKSAL